MEGGGKSDPTFSIVYATPSLLQQQARWPIQPRLGVRRTYHRRLRREGDASPVVDGLVGNHSETDQVRVVVERPFRAVRALAAHTATRSRPRTSPCRPTRLYTAHTHTPVMLATTTRAATGDQGH